MGFTHFRLSSLLTLSTPQCFSFRHKSQKQTNNFSFFPFPLKEAQKASIVEKLSTDINKILLALKDFPKITLYLRISIFHSLIYLVPIGRYFSSSLFIGGILLINLFHSTSCLGLLCTLVNLSYLHLGKLQINKSQSINHIRVYKKSNGTHDALLVMVLELPTRWSMIWSVDV